MLLFKWDHLYPQKMGQPLCFCELFEYIFKMHKYCCIHTKHEVVEQWNSIWKNMTDLLQELTQNVDVSMAGHTLDDHQVLTNF